MPANTVIPHASYSYEKKLCWVLSKYSYVLRLQGLWSLGIPSHQSKMGCSCTSSSQFALPELQRGLPVFFGEMHRERPSHCPGDYCKVMLRASDADSSSLFHWQSLSAGYRKKDAEELRVKQPFCPRFPHLLPLYISSAVSQCRRAVTALAHACDTWLQRKNCKPLSLKQH